MRQLIVGFLFGASACFVISRVAGDYKRKERQRELALSFQFWLLVAIFVAFFSTSAFTVSVLTGLARENASQVIQTTIQGIQSAIGQKGQIRDVVEFMPNCHIGQSGNVILCDGNLSILTARNRGKSLKDAGIFDQYREEQQSGVCFETTIYGITAYCMYEKADGYYIIGYLPVSEAMFSRNVTTYVLIFGEVIIFAVLFVLIYLLIKKLVVDKIGRINNSLEAITSGNLDVMVDVRSHKEFASLSDDINSTVATLKRYIAEAAARIDRELEFAKEIQLAALPSVSPMYSHREEFDIYATMETAKEVGGDFYDFYQIGDDTLAFLIADVSDKGIPAAMFMMTAKTTLKGFAESGSSVDEVCTKANEKLCENNDKDMFVTAWMGMLNLKTGLIQFVNAGHNPPLVRYQGGSFEYLKTRANLALAAMDGVKYRLCELTLQPGDEIFLYTDGVTEAANEEKLLFGEESLMQVMNTNSYDDMKELCHIVRENVTDFVENAPQSDDITMLALKYRGGVANEGTDD